MVRCVTAAAFLRRLHEITTAWPQRPGFTSTRDLLTTDYGGDVDLSAMPPDAVTDCRRAWARLEGSPQAVVHGDPGPANIRESPWCTVPLASPQAHARPVA